MSDSTAPRVRRIFEFNGTRLSDPDPAMGPDEVRKHYGKSGYPTLTNGSTQGPENQDGKQIYTFKATVGTKG